MYWCVCQQLWNLQLFAAYKLTIISDFSANGLYFNSRLNAANFNSNSKSHGFSGGEQPRTLWPRWELFRNSVWHPGNRESALKSCNSLNHKVCKKVKNVDEVFLHTFPEITTMKWKAEGQFYISCKNSPGNYAQIWHAKPSVGVKLHQFTWNMVPVTNCRLKCQIEFGWTMVSRWIYPALYR